MIMKKILTLLMLLCFSSLLSMADNPPSFPGGQGALEEYLAKNTRYPDIAKENGVEGIVPVGFIVLTDGNLTQIKVIKFIDPDLEKEALRVVGTMPVWIPAEKDGHPIEAPAKVEVPFILE